MYENRGQLRNNRAGNIKQASSMTYYTIFLLEASDMKRLLTSALLAVGSPLQPFLDWSSRHPQSSQNLLNLVYNLWKHSAPPIDSKL